MKTILLNCSLLLLAIAAMAQPTITTANKFKPGDWWTNLDAETTGVAIAGTGPNQIWNYSGLTPKPNSQSFDSISAPGGVVIPPNFIGTNLMTHSRHSNGTGIDSFYSFLKVTGDTVREMGYYAPSFNYLQYNLNPTTVFPYYPFTYGDSCMDSTISIVNFGGLIDTTSITVKFNVTGYGTLVLPGNRTFNNVLQVKRIRREVSSFGVNESTSMLYLKEGNPFPLMIMLLFQGGIDNIEYMTNYYTAPAGPTYTFTGNGNWNNPANWQGGIMPPGNIPPGSSIVISHAPGGSCIINVPVTIPPGVQFIVSPGANLVLPGNLTIQ